MGPKLKAQWTHPPRFEDVTSELEIEPARTAFILVDYQNDFAHPQGFIAAKGVDMTRISRIIEPTKRVATVCRKIGIRNIYTVIQFLPDLSDAGSEFEAWHARPYNVTLGEKVGPPGEKLGCLIKDTWNTAIINELTPQPGEIVVDKRVYSGFYNTQLEFILRKLNIDTLLFGGITTATCVQCTLVDAFFRNFRCILLTDCADEYTEERKRVSENWVKSHLGYVSTSTEFVKAVGKASTVA